MNLGNMITKFKIFEEMFHERDIEEISRRLLSHPQGQPYGIGDRVYYHGSLKDVHGYYIIQRIFQVVNFEEPEKGDNGWRYNLNNNQRALRGVWGMSLSPNEEEGRRKYLEYHKRKEDLRLLHIEHDPYGEEIWENVNNDIDPYNEENWNEDKEKEEFERGILDALDDLDYDHDLETAMNRRRGNICRICGRYAPNDMMLDQVCQGCRDYNDRFLNHCRSCDRYMPEKYLDLNGYCEMCSKDPLWDVEIPGK